MLIGSFMAQKNDKEDYPESVSYVSSEIIDLPSHTRHRNGTNDYSTESTSVITIVDRVGIRHEGIWEQNWSTLSTGVFSRQVDGVQQLKIEHDVFPVRVLYRAFREYVSYDFQSHCQQSSEYYWVKYIFDEDGKK